MIIRAPFFVYLCDYDKVSDTGIGQWYKRAGDN